MEGRRMMRLCPFCHHNAFIDTECPICGATIEAIRAKEESQCNTCRFYLAGYDMCSRHLSNKNLDNVQNCPDYEGVKE